MGQIDNNLKIYKDLMYLTSIFISYFNSSSHWGSSVKFILRSDNLMLSLGSQVHHSVSSIQCGPDLFIGANESLQFNIQVFILTLENIAVGLYGIDFRF